MATDRQKEAGRRNLVKARQARSIGHMATACPGAARA
jgi:hypothetical protein